MACFTASLPLDANPLRFPGGKEPEGGGMVAAATAAAAANGCMGDGTERQHSRSILGDAGDTAVDTSIARARQVLFTSVASNRFIIEFVADSTYSQWFCFVLFYVLADSDMFERGASG